MKVRVRFTRRYGREIPWRDVLNSTPLEGQLHLATTDYRQHGRVPHLDLTDPENTTPVGHLATLLYPELEGLGHGMIVFRGFEAIAGADGKHSYLQYWRCEVLPC